MSVTRVQLVGNVSGDAVFNNDVGIGTTNPTSKLHIVGNTLVTGVSTATSIVVGSGGTAGAPSISPSGDSNTGIFFPSADTLAFSEGGVERARIDSAGKVLVGTEATNRFVSLHTNDSVSSNAGIEIFRAVPTSNPLNAGLVITVNPANNHGQSGLVLAKTNGNANGSFTAVQPGTLGSVVFAGADGSSLRPAAQITGVGGTPNSGISPGSLPGQLTFSTTDVGGTTPTERMMIDSSGRLLVGTSSARQSRLGGGSFHTQIQLESEDNTSGLAASRFNDAAGSSFVNLQKGRGTIASPAAVIANDVTGTILFSGWDGAAFTNSALIRSEVDAGPGIDDMPGRLVFSTTANGDSSVTERMRIDSDGDIYFNTTAAPNTTSFGTRISTILSHSRNTPTAAVAQFYGSAGTARILGNGNVQNTNNSYGAISDINLKEKIVDASSQWDDIKALKVRNYNLKEGSTHTQIGVIAQEVELVSPGLVAEYVDENTDESIKCVNYSVLYMKAVKALQEAMERIEQLESIVATLQQS